MFAPRLDILPTPQRTLWPELSLTPTHFTLYGGTAIALRLGHRISIDFDFFSTTPFEPTALQSSIPYLANSTLRQVAPNTLTVTVDRAGPVQLSFFGHLRIGQVAPAETLANPSITIASLMDLAGMKMAVITQRLEVKDYLDIHALLTQARIPLAHMLAAAMAIYGNRFSPLASLKALSYHDDIPLDAFPTSQRRDLLAAIRTVDLTDLPELTPIRSAPTIP